jgi:hypothetical protein
MWQAFAHARRALLRGMRRRQSNAGIVLSCRCSKQTRFSVKRMSYSNCDLCVFEVLLDPAKRDGTAYFEFHPKELPQAYACWLPGSLLLRDAAFDFYAECFHRASDSFDDFSFERFGPNEIEKLIGELNSFQNILNALPDREQLFSRYDSLFTRDVWAGVDTPSLLSAAQKTCGQLLTFIKAETKQSKCLWVLGM